MPFRRGLFALLSEGKARVKGLRAGSGAAKAGQCHPRHHHGARTGRDQEGQGARQVRDHDADKGPDHGEPVGRLWQRALKGQRRGKRARKAEPLVTRPPPPPRDTRDDDAPPEIILPSRFLQISEKTNALITEAHVWRAILKNKKIWVSRQSRLTPAARDLGKSRNVFEFEL